MAEDQPEDVPAGLLLLALGERRWGGGTNIAAQDASTSARRRPRVGFVTSVPSPSPGLVGDAQKSPRTGGLGDAEGANVRW